jgi:hypothetical protein
MNPSDACWWLDGYLSGKEKLTDDQLKVVRDTIKAALKGTSSSYQQNLAAQQMAANGLYRGQG